MAMKNLQDAFIDALKDLLSAEKQLLRALPKMAKNTSDVQLRQAFEEHQQQTEQHVQRVEQIFESLGRRASSHKCEAMHGLIQENEQALSKDTAPEVLDAKIIAGAQKAEHYEIASYGTLCSWAEQLGLNDALDLLRQNLAEEKETDEKLSKMAKRKINRQAA